MTKVQKSRGPEKGYAIFSIGGKMKKCAYTILFKPADVLKEVPHVLWALFRHDYHVYDRDVWSDVRKFLYLGTPVL
tara:strand:+ start:203 stop:430 length:228 start_codon:yes stop_codon:yes gene_type:complete